MATGKIRHWKQRFDPRTKYVWRKDMLFAGENYKIGDEIPDSLAENLNKLRIFWESRVIELKIFEAPDIVTGEVSNKEEIEYFFVDDVDSDLGSPTIYYYKDVNAEIGDWVVVDDAMGEEYTVENKEQAEILALALRDEALEKLK